MELKIISKKEEPLFARICIESEIMFDKSTPSKEDVKNKLAEVLKKDGNLIVIKSIDTSYGLKKAKCLSFCYDNEQVLKKTEPRAKKSDAEKKKSDKEEAKDKPEEAK